MNYQFVKESIKFFKIFIFIFLIFIILFNWSLIVGILNYKNIYSNFLNKNTDEKNTTETGINYKEATEMYWEEEDSVEIPKLNTLAPLVFVADSEMASFDAGLNSGVVHFPESSLPGVDGQIIILGHSAPAGWMSKNYEDVFTKINELTAGDEVIVFYNHRKYTYQVVGQVILAQGQDVPRLSEVGQELALVTCWPPGKNYKRIAIRAIRTQ